MKNYSLIVHAIHSRLQLIRNKLDVTPDMLPDVVVIRNRKYFDRAAESVLLQNEYRCTRSDFYDAAELFLLSLDQNEKEILNQPLWKKK